VNPKKTRPVQLWPQTRNKELYFA